MMKIACIIGARPQFIKHVALEHALKDDFDLISIHTGQHYDYEMSEVFFDELGIQKPTYHIDSKRDTELEQFSAMCVEMETILIKEQPNYVLVYGDTNSTFAGALTAEKCGIKIIHVEAGLRSYNRLMPEEINRVLTDKLSSLLFVPNVQAKVQLEKEGTTDGVHVVGDIMKDCVLMFKDVIEYEPQPYLYLTLHRGYNVDHTERLKEILSHVNDLGIPTIFPVHPRTQKTIETSDIQLDDYPNIKFTNSLSYLDSLKQLLQCHALLTDSGGMQKEAYFLRKRCITLRSETEWTETLEGNWNQLCFDRLDQLQEMLTVNLENHNSNLYGSGDAGEQMRNILLNNA